MAFVIIGALGFVWMGFWVFLYKRPRESRWVNEAELAYIEQNEEEEEPQASSKGENLPKMSFLQCIRYKQAWAFAVGKFLTDGIWWFFLFWTPAYLSDVYHLPSNAPMAQLLIFVLYAITMLSIIGGWLPTYFVEKKGMNPYKGRMRAMLIFAFFPIITLLAQPLGAYSYWYPIIIIGIAGAAHQAWSSNIYCTVSDMFPQNEAWREASAPRSSIWVRESCSTMPPTPSSPLWALQESRQDISSSFASARWHTSSDGLS